ncbi:MAG: F0F1 ATP synthase subunit B [Pseudorhodobacter sp.]
MKKLILPGIMSVASPAFAASGPFFSLGNTDFIVLISFLIFVGVLIYLGIPRKVTDLLDKRSDTIRSDLDEARALREEAKAVLAGYERKRKEVQEQADRIVATAKEEAKAAAEQAKEDLKTAIARRLAAAEDRIASAEAGAVRAVREQAITIAVGAAGDVLSKQMTADNAKASIDDAIKIVNDRLH